MEPFSFLFTVLLSFYTITFLTVSGHEMAFETAWTSGRNDRFADMSLAQLKLFLGVRKSKVPASDGFSELQEITGEEMPERFDVRKMWPNCSGIISTVRDQSACGSCWATASASVMSDVTCIRCNGQYSPYISDEDLLSCCSQCGDCNGGEIGIAFEYWIATGLVTGGPYGSGRGCRPFSIPPQRHLNGKHPSTPQCRRACQDGYPIGYWEDLRKGNFSHWVSGPVLMQNRIYQSGPIVAMFDIHESFMREYKGGIYSCPDRGDQVIGFHAAKVIGWGTENGVPYWLGVNSWGTSWGQNGFFKIRRGQNDCDFERTAFWAIASENACFDTASNFTSANGECRTQPIGLIRYSLLSLLIAFASIDWIHDHW